ncbi:hypothetical protein BDQ17DRAFT_1344186 [Cyathus striatus]|nr:hypothetical protein BDQ17DRAFT_1344186 [Cyathus striatus]
MKLMKDTYKPLHRHRTVSGTAFCLLLGAFILFLLVAISLPIIKPIYLLTFGAATEPQILTNVAAELHFGVWGVCVNTISNTLIFCTKPRLGYDIPPFLVSLIGASQESVDVVEKALLVILILHPIAAGLSLATLFTSLFLASHGCSIFTLILAIVTAIVSTVVFGVDLAVVMVGRNKFKVNFGNGVWMILGGVVATWLAVVFLSARACYCCGVRRPNHRHYNGRY